MTEPGPTPETTGNPEPVGPPPPARASVWRGRRVLLLVAGAAVLVGCVLGAGVTGAVALIGHEGDRGHSVRDEGNDGRHRRGEDERKAPAATPAPSESKAAPAPSPTATSPTASPSAT